MENKEALEILKSKLNRINDKFFKIGNYRKSIPLDIIKEKEALQHFISLGENLERIEGSALIPRYKNPLATEGVYSAWNEGEAKFWNACRQETKLLYLKNWPKVEGISKFLKTFLFIDKNKIPNCWLNLSVNEREELAQAILDYFNKKLGVK